MPHKPYNPPKQPVMQPATQQPVSPIQDILGRMLQLWTEAQDKTRGEGYKPTAEDMAEDAAIQDFVNFGREKMQSNLPVGLDYLGSSLGLRFQNGEVLRYVLGVENAGMMGGNGGCIPVTPGLRSAEQQGTTIEAPSWGITKPLGQ